MKESTSPHLALSWQKQEEIADAIRAGFGGNKAAFLQAVALDTDWADSAASQAYDHVRDHLRDYPHLNGTSRLGKAASSWAQANTEAPVRPRPPTPIAPPQPAAPRPAAPPTATRPQPTTHPSLGYVPAPIRQEAREERNAAPEGGQLNGYGFPIEQRAHLRRFLLDHPGQQGLDQFIEDNLAHGDPQRRTDAHLLAKELTRQLGQLVPGYNRERVSAAQEASTRAAQVQKAKEAGTPDWVTEHVSPEAVDLGLQTYGGLRRGFEDLGAGIMGLAEGSTPWRATYAVKALLQGKAPRLPSTLKLIQGNLKLVERNTKTEALREPRSDSPLLSGLGSLLADQAQQAPAAALAAAGGEFLPFAGWATSIASRLPESTSPLLRYLVGRGLEGFMQGPADAALQGDMSPENVARNMANDAGTGIISGGTRYGWNRVRGLPGVPDEGSAAPGQRETASQPSRPGPQRPRAPQVQPTPAGPTSRGRAHAQARPGARTNQRAPAQGETGSQQHARGSARPAEPHEAAPPPRSQAAPHEAAAASPTAHPDLQRASQYAKSHPYGPLASAQRATGVKGSLARFVVREMRRARSQGSGSYAADAGGRRMSWQATRDALQVAGYSKRAVEQAYPHWKHPVLSRVPWLLPFVR